MIVFVVLGRLGKSLSRYKIDPIINSAKVDKVYAFREEEGYPIEGVTYITLPVQLRNADGLRKLSRMCYELRQLYCHAKKYRPALINGVFTMPKGLYSVIVGRMLHIRTMVSVIGGEVEITNTDTRHPALMERLVLWILKKADIVTTKGTKVSRCIIERGIDPAKVHVFNGSIDTLTYKPNKNIRRDIDVLFVGSFSPLKGPDRVLETVKKLKEHGIINVNAVFLGSGELFDEIRAKVNEYGMQNNVTLEGYRENTVGYFQRARILMMPSRSEGLASAMLEAMSCGCVPVVSDVGNMTDAAKHAFNAYVVSDHMDVEGFTKHIQELLQNEKLRLDIAKNGSEFVHDHYSLQVQSKIFEEMIS